MKHETKQKDLSNAWAWSRVEAMADGSLDGPDVERMRVAMQADAELRGAVERAGAITRALGRMPRERVPAGLLSRVLSVPAPRRPIWSWAAVPAAGLIAAVIGIALYEGQAFNGAPEPLEDPRLAAVQEFNIAMYYLQKSMAITNEEVEREVENGLLGSIAVSRRHLGNEQDETGG
jgi:hypothetical protein